MFDVIRTRFLWIARLVPLLGLLSVFTTAQAELFEAHEYKLDNGLHLVVLPNHLSPIVHHMLFYKAGSAEEVPGTSGTAHYLEHMMFKGTDTTADGEFSARVAENGGSENAFTSFDFTGYFQTVSKENLGMVMELEADRMVNLKLSPDMVGPELAVVREERRQRTDNNPRGILSEESRAAMYQNHPYGRPIIGWAHEVAALGLDDILDFYHAWYAPNNAVLVVGGDVEPEAVLALAKQHYGPVAYKEVPERKRPFEPKHRVTRKMEFADRRVGLPSWSIQYAAPSLREDPVLFGDLGVGSGFGQHEAVYALTVFADAFGGGSGSPLYKRLVIDEKVAAGVGAFYSSAQSDYGTLGFYVAPNAGSELEPAVAALKVEISNLLEDGIDADKVAESKRRLIRSAVLARDDLKTAPNLVGRSLALGATLDQVQSWADRINAVTPEVINNVIRALVREEGSTISIIRPKKKRG